MGTLKALGTVTVLAAVVSAGDVHPARAQADMDVAVLLRLPVGHIWIDVGRTRYAYHDGVFYRPHRRGHGFVRVPAPIGAVLASLPRGAARRFVRGHDHYVHRGVWYRPEYRRGRLVFIVQGHGTPRAVWDSPYRYGWGHRRQVRRPPARWGRRCPPW